ncbi:MAG: helicase C-terminal domain-containing protein [Patescibacteria group bacterium]
MTTNQGDAFIHHFPFEDARSVQRQALAFIAAHPNDALLEIPTGEGKTAIGLAVLRTLAAQGRSPLFYVTPTKAQVEQIATLFPNDVEKILGRNEYPCLYYRDLGIEGVNAEESPCYMLKCGHRVDQQSGETEEEGAEPCPYFQQKLVTLRRSKEGKAIITTNAFFLMNRLFVPEWRDMDPALVVFDEVHRLPTTARAIFEHSLTDSHLLKLSKILKRVDRAQTAIIVRFVRAFKKITRKRPARAPSLLKDEELVRLIAILRELDPKALERSVRSAVKSGTIDPVQDKSELKLLENLARSIPRMIHSIEMSMEGEGRRPLNYVVAYYVEDDEFSESGKKIQYRLTIKNYFVAPLIRKVAGNRILAYSATIGDAKIFGYESGLRLTHMSALSSFDTKKTRVWLPSDTPNLSTKSRRRGDLNKTLRTIVRSAKQFADAGKRSLVVVVSEAERTKFLEFATESALDVTTYGNGINARQAAAMFKEGRGSVLLGTIAQYAEGVDLPRGTAPVIFFLRPGYQRPDDPQTQFEERRFSQGQCWAIWNWRVMMEALQVRGRNIRTVDDLGVCFFISQQFRRFLYSALPQWLRPAYDGQRSMEKAVDETMKLLK